MTYNYKVELTGVGSRSSTLNCFRYSHI